MLSVKNAFPEHQWVVARAPSLPASLYHKIIGDENIPVINDTTYELLHHADAALVTSGTATLETALLNVPQVVCYKGGRISYLIARSLVKIRYISLVNLILEKEAVQELIQHALKTDSLVTALRKILNPDVRKIIFSDYAALKHKLKLGGAAARTAGLILQDMKDGIPAGPE
jgi:lipid-A-disaccharide synthase